MTDDKPTLMILAVPDDDDDMITLDDGSKWEIDPGSLPTASTWYPSSIVTVRHIDEGSDYPFEITRDVDGDSIRVRKVT